MAVAHSSLDSNGRLGFWKVSVQLVTILNIWSTRIMSFADIRAAVGGMPRKGDEETK